MTHSWKDLIKDSSSDVRRLASVWRFNSIPTAVNENTAEHSFWVALYACMIHREVDPNDHVILGAIALESIVHDVDECVTGDVVRTFKYVTQEFKEAVDKAEKVLSDQLPSSIRDLTKSISNFPDETNQYIKAVVKAADFLSLFQFMRREAMRGNLEIFPFYSRMMKDLHMMELNSCEKKYVPSPTSNCSFDASKFYYDLHHEATMVQGICFRDTFELLKRGMKIV